MKLLGFVEVVNHQHNVPVSRSRHSTLTIFRDKDEAVMLVQQPSNKRGQRYKIAGNIIKVFTQFVSQGKVTIRMKEPPHELRLQNEPVQLMSFLKFLKNCSGPAVSTLPAVPDNPKFTKGPPTTVVINSMKDYGKLDKLSLNTERLQISNIKISELPRSVARLKKLNLLEVSDTNLSAVPPFIKTLPNLMELVLPNNNLRTNDLNVIIESASLKTNLRLLDLRHNKIAVLPNEIHRLQALVTLRLDHNELNTIPHTISNLKNLRCLSLSDNIIISYPYSVRFLRHVAFDVSNNKHVFPGPLPRDTDWSRAIRSEKELTLARYTGMHSLKELASRVLFDKRLDFTEFGLPLALQRHLQCFKMCHLCHKACFDEYFIFFECIPLKFCVAALVSSVPGMTVHYYICSLKCMLLAYPKLNKHSQAGLRYVSYSKYCKCEK
ncbi:leucine-rich repeat protein 1 [Schistocerca serialis cubense]|uniref:leucine-rich repeat protein 1 n=1 Tax=Schistocerca serialis cubense TaxID=2023355 RepID=UPI00214E9064|nr:leucine-rich repeat protein 1 [Schistocerca serialis cubense]